jgi:putative transposase
VLNYIVTSNHIHLLVRDQGRGEFARAMQLIGGRVGQAFNQRKGRKGAFWEDRYHATAVETGEHLARCLVYIDLNMVRAGVVSHPSEWALSGYREIQSPPERYRVIDQQALLGVLEMRTLEELGRSHRLWGEEALRSGRAERGELWTGALAVGSVNHVERVHEALGVGARTRTIEVMDDRACVREVSPVYKAGLGP